jgi:hypothetical protein
MKRMACYPEVCRSVYDWSLTPGSNAGADAQINFAEGQLPSSLNDSARALMAAVAAWMKDEGAGMTTGGTSTAYTLTLTQTMQSAKPALIGFKAHTTNTGACTLNVDGLGANPLRAKTGVALAAGAIVSGCVYLATWVAGSSEWLLLNPAVGAVPLEGGTMTGLLTLSGNPSTNLQAATKQYVDTGDAASVAHTVSAGTGLTGGGAISTNPTIGIAASGVSATELASNAVTTAKLLDANVTPAKLSQPLTIATKQATTSGTSITFASIPSWVSTIRLVLQGVSTSGTAVLRTRLGTGGSPVTSGYISLNSVLAGGAQTQNSATAGFDLGGTSAASVYNGFLTLSLIDAATNFWACQGVILQDNNNQHILGGHISLAGSLDRVILTTANGTDAFDAGSANVIYQ